jgi:hypothetical protein
LCVFVALALREVPSETVLIIDDVLASVDEPHVSRIIEMLYVEALRFRHCIMTTHYRPWKEKFRWGMLKSGDCQFVELGSWSLAGGLTQYSTLPPVDSLRALLGAKPPDPQLVCAKAGVILEGILDFLTVRYGCLTPRRVVPQYTLGELLDAFDKKLKAALRVDVLGKDANGDPQYETKALGPYLSELKRIAQVRNVVGCHFNEISFLLLDADSIAFGQQVLELAEAIVDPVAGWPKSDKSGSYWATKGETRRLHPLKRPG